jgi:anti-anti-sigma regulatory factor
MAAPSDVLILTLSEPVTPEALDVLRHDVTGALEAGRKAFLLDIDGVGQLASPTLAGLISVLREARESGAVVALQASRKPLLDTLRVTALDKIFTIVTPLGPAPGAPAANAPARRRKHPQIVAALVAGALLAGFAGRASADDGVSAVEIIHNVVAQKARIRSYQATISVDVHLRSFPYLSQHLDGTTYFKWPDSVEVVFTKVPRIANGFDKLYTDIDDPTSWERRFDLSLAGDKTIEGRRDLVVRLVQKVRGMIDHEDVAVDPQTWRIDAMEWHYYNGGTIAMSQEYADVGGFSVIAAQHATIRIPFVHAAADATYRDYKTNVAIDDSVFTREKR